MISIDYLTLVTQITMLDLRKSFYRFLSGLLSLISFKILRFVIV